MTKNEAMWQAMCLYASRGEGYYDAYDMAEQLTHQAEIRNCAPWQDTQKPAVELNDIDVHPVRKEITEADIYLGAKFSASPAGRIRYHVHGMPTSDEQIISFTYHSYKGDQHQDSAVLSDFVRMLNTIGARVI